MKLSERVENFYKSLSENEKNDLVDVVIANLTPSQILERVKDKNTLYRLLWADYMYEDVYGFVKENGYSLNESGVQEVVDRYVYNGDYDCNLSYWDNINNLVQEVLENRANRKMEENCEKQEDKLNETKYYELCYFYGRKDSGSVYVKTTLDFDSYYEEEFLQKLVERNELEAEYIDAITDIEEIDKETYCDMTGEELPDEEQERD